MNNLNRSAMPGKYLVDCDGCGGVFYQNEVHYDQYKLIMCDHCIDPIWKTDYRLPKHKEPEFIQPATPDVFRVVTDPTGQYNEASAGIPLNE